MTLSKYAAAAAIATMTAIAAPAGVAHAGEAGYLARLAVDYDYVITPENEPAALRAGYILCDELRQGRTRDQMAASVYAAIPNATREQAFGMAYAAQRELCPETAE